ncbi:hypothetical protein ACFU7Z_13585 [Kitasatospora sp. NPDC057518]|uniref:hypothetical protein n=1 Tax=Kitasatospora sp. NPDC057518 TaxID=3346155 RepID=UPI0036CDE8DF
MTEPSSTGPACTRPGCGRPLPKAATGRPALHCSPACRQAEHRRRRLEEQLPALRDEARTLLARLGGDEQARQVLEGLDGGQAAVFVRHARAAQAALDGAFALLGLPAPALNQAARERQGDTAASALAAAPAPAGRGKRAQVHGQQAVPENLLTAFQNACGAGADETTARPDAPIPDGDHGHGESPSRGEGPDRGRAPAAEPVRVRAALPPDTRPLPTTTAYDELLPTCRRARPKTPDHPAGGTPGETGRKTTRAAGANTEQPGPARRSAGPGGNDGTARARHTTTTTGTRQVATAAGAQLTVVFDDGTPHTHPEPARSRPTTPEDTETEPTTPPGPGQEQDDTTPAATEDELAAAARPDPGLVGEVGDDAVAEPRERPDAPDAEPESGPDYDGGAQRQKDPAPGRGRDDDALAATGDGPATDSGRADTAVVPAPTPDSHDALAAAEAKLATAARALVGDPTSGLSKAVERQLYWHTAALAADNTTVLPAACQATADLAHRRGRLRLPDTPQGRRLRAALAAYENTWNTTRTSTANTTRNSTGNGTVTGPQDDPPQPHP